MKLKTVVESWNALNNLFSKELTLATSFKLEGLLSKLEQPVMSYEKRRLEILKKYGKDNGDGTFEVNFENAKEFASQVEELLDVDLDVSIPEIKIKLTNDITLSAKDVRSLKNFVVFEGGEE